jgi:hypothetical protein
MVARLFDGLPTAIGITPWEGVGEVAVVAPG